MRKTTNDQYFDFLCSIVGRTYEYSLLLKHLHGIEFYSLVPNDDNRAEDGKHLREIFADSEAAAVMPVTLNEEEPHGSFSMQNLEDIPCTMLEMLIGLAKHLEFDLCGSRYGRSVGEWFWVLIDNLGLEWCDNVDWNPHIVDEKIQILLERRYSENGEGGTFPLKVAQKDQRRVEIWYQMSAWVIENYPI